MGAAFILLFNPFKRLARTQSKRSSLRLFKVLSLMLMLFAGKVYSVCSPYYALATLNEAGKVGFVETKLLWSSIPASEYNTWTIRICTTSSCTTVAVNGSTLYNNVYLVTLTAGLIPNNAVFDIRLRDASGRTIDYLTVGNYTPQFDSSCTPYFDYTASVSNSHDYRRKPDGTGNWGNAGSGNSGGNTGGGTNDVGLPLISSADITLIKGNTAIFTVTIPSAQSFNITFQYQTVDGDANSTDHYTYQTGTAIIPAGSTSTTISIATTPNSPGGTVVFYLLLYNSVNGTISNHFPAANLLDAPSVDHYLIEHDGQGLTCEAESITIKACANASCSTLSTESVTLNFQANGVTKSTPTFTGSTLVSLVQTTPTTLTLSIDNPSIAPTNPLVCDDGAGTSCDIVFNDTGFLFYGDGTVDNIGNQIAGKFSDVAPNGQPVTIRAVQSNPLTGQCDALINNATANIGFIYQCDDPATCALNTNGMDIDDNGFIVDDDTNAYTNINVSFDATGTGTFKFNYLDAGRITLKASATLAVGTETVNVQGNSNSFWVSPDKLVVTARSGGTDLNNTADSGSPTHIAGVNFDFEVTALNLLGAPTANYLPGQIQLLLERKGPTVGGTEGALTYASGSSIFSQLASAPVTPQNVALTAFSAGVSTFNAANYSEVGLINLDIQDANYGGSGILVIGDAINIGRFIPDHFVISTPIITPSCSGIFTYGGFLDGANAGLDRNGQPFSVIGTITAENGLATPTTTQNYTGTFAKLTDAGFSLQAHNFDSALNAAGIVNYAAGLSFVNGVSSYTDTTTDYQFDALSAPFNLRLDFDATDSDNVIGSTTSNTFEVRLGRMILQDSYGPEISDLEMRLKTEYFDGTQWILNTQDSCSIYQDTLVSIGTYSGSGGTAVQPSIGTPTLISGVSLLGFGLKFDAPGDGNYGSAEVRLDLLTLLDQGWLRYDWDGDNTIESFTSGTLNFGYYRGSDRVIYWQEQ